MKLDEFKITRLVDKLLGQEDVWQEQEKWYFNEHLPRIIDNMANASPKERATLKEIRAIASNEQWSSLPTIIKRRIDEWNEDKRKQESIIENYAHARSLLKQYEFTLADKYIQGHQSVFSDQQNKSLIKISLAKRVEQLLSKYDYSGADKMRETHPNVLSDKEYFDLKDKYRCQQEKEKIILLLKAGDYLQADALTLSGKGLPKNEYEKLKAKYIKIYLEKELSSESNEFVLDEEKAKAIAKMSSALLLKARAGSGKTMAIACKALFLVKKEDISPDEMLVLAFNKKAKNDIADRLRKYLKTGPFSTAMTFHGLAYKLAPPTAGTILFDDKGEYSRKNQSEYVQKLVRQIWNPLFKYQLYTYFRKEMEEVEQYGLSKSDPDYLMFRRNMRDVTLKGDQVKSSGEKYIADYLFEHDIEYYYEKAYFMYKGKHIYRPDFTIIHQGKDVVLEHWGIDENDQERKAPIDWTKTWEEYHNEMEEKRKYWKEKGSILVETSIRDLVGGRDKFEEILESRLSLKGVKRDKMSESVIVEKVVDIKKAKITSMFLQYIQKAKKTLLTAKKLEELINNGNYTKRVSAFLKLANKVYWEYENKLKQDKQIDFDDLVMNATDKIHETKGRCLIHVNRQDINISSLKWIMIDEYQDFSELFYGLIDAIRKYNKSIKVLCVGDDWQAINAFAGSNLKYFIKYHEYFHKSDCSELLFNYRCCKRVVECSNKLMEGKGDPGRSKPDKPDGEVNVIYIDDVYLEMRKGQGNKATNKFIVPYDNGYTKSKYLKKCYEIVMENMGPDKEIVLLCRTNLFYGMELDDFRKRLVNCFTREEISRGKLKDNVRIGTAHSYKGLEGNVVIILGVCECNFPLIHPDNVLYEIFGQTSKEILDEEKRLFYVALTRAKERLYLLTEEGRESVYLGPGYMGLIKK